jgi:hypothetical protein
MSRSGSAVCHCIPRYIVTLVVPWASGRILEHGYCIICAIPTTLVGAVILISTLNTGARYLSLVLLCRGLLFSLNAQLFWDTIGSPSFKNQEPRYQNVGRAIIVGYGLTNILCLVTNWWCKRKNKALIAEEERAGMLNSWRYALKVAGYDNKFLPGGRSNVRHNYTVLVEFRERNRERGSK